MARATLLLAVAAACLAACGGHAPSGATSPTPTAGGDVQGATASSTAAPPKAGVLLPDTTDPRWDTSVSPALASAFKAAGVPADIRNARGSAARFTAFADDMLTRGRVTVLLMAGIDGATARGVVRKARAVDVPVVDLDRLTPGGASYYVGFDDARVGRAIGEGLVKCLQDDKRRRGRVALLPGARGDTADELAAAAAERALAAAGYRVVVGKAVPGGRASAARQAFARVYRRARGRLAGVAAVDDVVAGAAIAELARRGKDGRVLVAGRGATDPGLQRVLLGTQCLTIYEPTEPAAPAAAELAIALARGDRDAATGLATGSVSAPGSERVVPAVIETSRLIFPRSVREVIDDGSTTALRLCTTVPLQAVCTRYGVI